MAKFLSPNNEIIETQDEESPENEPLFQKAESQGFIRLADIVDPNTGTSHTIKRSELKQALDSGKFVIPQVYEATKAEEEARKPEFGPLGAAAAGFAKSATMGAAPAVGGVREALKGGKYETGRKRYEQMQEAAYQQQPTSYGIGYTAGVVPGLAAKGITGLGQIFLGAATPLVEEATKIDEPITAERAARETTSVALGAGLGSLGAIAQAKLPTAAQKIGKMAERRAVKAIGADVQKAEDIIERLPGQGQALGRDLLETGIVTAGKSVPQINQKARELQKISGEALDSIITGFDKKIGTPSINRAELLAEVEKIPAELAANPSTEALAERVNSIFVERLRRWAERGDAASIKEVWNIRKHLDKTAFTETGKDRPVHDVLQNIRAVIEDKMTDFAQRSGISPEEIAQYNKTKRLYQVSRTAGTISREKTKRMSKNRVFSLSDYLAGGTAGAGIGTQMAGAPGGLIGIALGALGNKLARERGPQVAAATLDSLSRMMKEDPDRFKAIMAQLIKTGSLEMGEE